MEKNWKSANTQTKNHLFLNYSNHYIFTKAYKCGPTVGLSNLSAHKIKLKDIGTFKTSLAAYEAYRDLKDNMYIKQLENCNPYQARTIGIKKNKQIKNKRQVMKNILKIKLEQHPSINNTLINSGFRFIYYTYKFNDFWGLGKNNSGNNELGKLWMELRNNFY